MLMHTSLPDDQRKYKMSKEEAEPDVVALVVSKGNIPDPLSGVQHCDHDDTAVQAQSDDRLGPVNDWICPEDDNNRVRGDACISKEGDCKGRSYFYHHGIGQTYNQDGTPNRSCVEEISNHCKQEEMPHDHDRNYKNQQSNYDDNNYNADQDQSKYFVYAEEHTYQRKGKAPPNGEAHLETSSDYQTTDETLKQTDESLTLPHESHVNTINLCSKSRSFIQMTNLPVEVQESGQQRQYEYLEDSTNQRSATSPDKHEIHVFREYVYPGSNYVHQKEGNFNISRDSCHNEYYNYELQNEQIYQSEVTASTTQQPSQEQSYIHQSDDGRFNREEPPTIECENYQDRNYSYQQDDNSSENKTYRMHKEPHQERTYDEKDDFQRKCSSLQVEENDYMCEDNGTFQRDESSAVDLRVLRYSSSPREIETSYNSLQEPLVVSQVTDNFHFTENSRGKASPSETCNNQDSHLSTSSYIIPDQPFYEEEHINPTQQPRKCESHNYSLCETTDIENNHLWDATTNTDRTIVEDKESQTGLTEVRDVAVQTDVENKVIPLALFKNIQEEIAKHACPICQRVYISKSSFDRHLRTHEKEKNNNVIANVRFTTEAKLQICKRAGKTKHLKTHKPIIIQVPRSIIQGDMSEKAFPNQKERDNHDCTLKPFPLTKCPECHIKFYTTGALNEHIGIVHKKESAYYCIFCNKSFSAGYNFHLHLDEHLPSQ